MSSAAPAPAEKDHWCPHTYTHTVAPFVPKLTTRVVALLAPHPTDTLLDLGCGDGQLTAQLALRVSSATGIDSSPAMLAAARATNAAQNTSYALVDCRRLCAFAAAHAPRYSKVFSNAALHWILRDAATRADVLAGAFELLRPGGVFVAEMGAHGNVAEVHAALIAALVHRGVGAAAAAAASPWYFPGAEEMRGLLVAAGFVVEAVETELRQTALTEVAGGGVEGWVRLFGEAFLQAVGGEEAREAVVREVVGVLEGVGRTAAGALTVNYVRLRFVARRPAE